MTTGKKKAANSIKGAAVFVAGNQKHMRAAAAAAGATLVEELTPNVDILVGDYDNRLVQQAHDLGILVWSECDLLTATGEEPPPPPPPSNKSQEEVNKKTIYVRRYPALPGDVADTNNGSAAALAYSWIDGTSSAEIELGLRFLFGVTSNDTLRLLDNRGCDVPITSAIPNGAILTLDIVPIWPSMHCIVRDISNRPNYSFNIGTCTASARSTRRLVPAPIRSHKRQRDNPQVRHQSTKRLASARLVTPAFKLAQPGSTAVKAEYSPITEKDDEAQLPLDVDLQHEKATKKLASEAQALYEWAGCANVNVAADGQKTEQTREGAADEAVPIRSEMLASLDVASPTVESTGDATASKGKVATGKAKLLKFVDTAKAVITQVTEKVAAVHKSPTFAARRTSATNKADTAAQGRRTTTDAIRSAHKQALNWLPSRPDRSDAFTPLRPSTPA